MPKVFMLKIIQAKSAKDMDQARRLFREYEAFIGISLCFQDFERELAELPGGYAPPDGRLLLAFVNKKAVGCVALRKISADVCEMKRFYVGPEFQGLGIGRALAVRIIQEAWNIGYLRMRLDTSARLKGALSLYRSLSFREIRQYRHNPLGDAIFMELDLGAARETRCKEILGRLNSLSNPEAVAGMARFGINPKNTYGVSIPNLRKIAKEAGKDHALAIQLWSSGIHEARILAGMIAEPEKLTETQMERWVLDFDSWDVCDQCCNNLFSKTAFAYKKAVEWSSRKEEFVKRAGFVLMACLAVHDKKAPDKNFEHFFPLIKAGSLDNRNFVKKAVNWALRQIGKRNKALNKKAIMLAKALQKLDSKSAKWVASDALRELENKT